MLYRNKYLVAIVEDDEYEFIFQLFENIYQAAKFFNKDVTTTRQQLDLFFTGCVKNYYYQGKAYKIEFIEDTEVNSSMLYKNKYMIGLYETRDDDDSLFQLFDNSREFADFFNITIYNASTILKKAFDRKTNFFKYQGRLLKIVFIEDTEDDEEE